MNAKWFRVERTDESPADMPTYVYAFTACDVKKWLDHGKHGAIVECSYVEPLQHGDAVNIV